MSELSSNLRADTTGEAGYAPIRNVGLAETITGTSEDSEEYLRVLSFQGDLHKVGNRVLHIVYDNVIGLAPDEHTELALTRINGDAVFVLNALLAKREEFQSARQIADFRSGFRGRTKQPEGIKNIPTHFGRAINALDHESKKHTGRIMIARTAWGSGVLKGSVPHMYKVHDDITVIDRRNPQQ